MKSQTRVNLLNLQKKLQQSVQRRLQLIDLIKCRRRIVDEEYVQTVYASSSIDDAVYYSVMLSAGYDLIQLLPEIKLNSEKDLILQMYLQQLYAEKAVIKQSAEEIRKIKYALKDEQREVSKVNLELYIERCIAKSKSTNV
jgi:hypothetical protein